MQSIFFWRQWISDYRYIWYGLAFIFVFSIAFLWYAQAGEAGNAIHWDKMQEQKIVETTVHSFQLGPLTLDIPADSYVIFEYFNGSGVFPDTSSSYLFLALLAVAAAVIMAVISTLEGFWFYGGVALIIGFVVALRLEIVGLFAMYNKTPTVAAALIYAGGCVYFNRLRPSTSFVVRLMSFIIITIVLALLIFLYADVELPFYHLTVTGYVPALLLSLFFIIMIAHEVFAFFILTVSQGKSKNLKHLSIIAAIYFFNLMIASLHEIGYITWDFVYINAYLLLSVSAVLGVWGFRERESLYGSVLSFYPFGAFLFLAMAMICFGTTAQLAGNGNDPALVIIRHMIIYSHTGYGLIFILYVVSNFIGMLAQSMRIDKVLYQPTRMPYFTYRLAGTIAMLSFFFVSDWQTYVYNGMGGFYNSTGDLYALMGNRTYAKAFYTQGKQYGYLNHRSNYALGTVEVAGLSFDDALESYRVASMKRPTTFSIVNHANILAWESENFEAIRDLRNIQRTHDTAPVRNNLAYYYAKVHNLDSALYYMDAARRDELTRASAETNFFAMAAVELLPFKADSIVEAFHSKSTGAYANAIALSTLFHKKFSVDVKPLDHPKLNLHAATLLNNYIVHNATTLDTLFTKRALAIASDSINADFSEALKASLAYAYYHQGNVSKALEMLSQLVFVSRQEYQGKYNYIMGLWALEQGNPTLASSYFTYANTFDYRHAKFYNAIALTEAHQRTDALIAWDSIANSQEESERLIAAEMKQVLTLSLAADMSSLTDVERYQVCRYRMSPKDTATFERTLNAFENANYKAQALLDMSQRNFESGNVARAIRYYNRIAGLELTDSALYNKVRHFELVMLASRGELKSLAQQINKGITFGPQRFLEKTWYTALLAEANGDLIKAEKNYNVLAAYNPYFEDGVIAAADFFKRRDEKGLKAYEILANAIQTNASSTKLLRAYIQEAARKGFDNYVVSAAEMLHTLEASEQY